MKWLRLLLGVLLAAAALLALVVVIVLGPLRGRTVDVIRLRVESALTAALQTPVTVGTLRLSFLPPTVEADDVRIGPDGALAHAQHLVGHLLVRTSLRQLRPVADVAVVAPAVDIPGWVELVERRPEGPPSLLPPFRLRVSLREVSIRLSDTPEPFALAAGGGAGELTSTLGRLRFAVTTHDVTLSHGAATLPLAQVVLNGGEIGDGWRLRAAEAVGEGIELRSATAVADRLPIRGHVALPHLAVFDELFARLGGVAQLDAALIGRLEDLAIGGTIAVPDFSADGERIGNVTATAEWKESTLDVSAARVVGYGGEADGSGTLTLNEPFAYKAQVRWSMLDLHRLASLEAIKPAAAGGEAQLSGTLAPLAVQGEGRGTVAPADCSSGTCRAPASPAGEALAWRGRASYRDGVGEGDIDADQARDNTLRGRLSIGPRRVLSGTLDAVVANPTALGSLLPIESLPNLSGSLTATAQVAGTTDDPRLAGQLGGRDVALLGVSIEELAGSFAIDRAALRTEGITADLAEGSLTLNGTIALEAAGENAWEVQATDVSSDTVVALVYALSGRVPPIGRGTLVAQVRGRGRWSQVELNGGATMRNFWLGSEWIEQATVEGSTAWPRWQLDAELRNRAGQTVELHGSGTGTDGLALRAESARWDLTTLQYGELEESGGRLSLEASFSGSLRTLSGAAALRARDLVVRGRRIDAFDLAVTATRGRWQASADPLEGRLHLRAELSAGPGWPYSVDAEWTDARFGRLLVPDSEIWIVSSGMLHVGGRLAAVDQFDATGRLDALRIVNGPFELTAARPALVQCRRGACTLDELELRGPDTQLRARGSAATSGAVQLAINGAGDLRLFELAGRTISSARGRFTIDAAVRRGGGAWDVSGRMTVDQAAIDVGGPAAFTRVSGLLTLAGTTVQIERLTGRMGTGTFEIGGALNLGTGPELIWTMTEVGAVPAPSLEVELSGEGTVTGTWQRMLVAGRLDVERMLYDRDIELIDFLPTINKTLADAPRPASAQRVAFDLELVAPGQLYVENNIARVEGSAHLRVTGTAAKPVLDGRIEVLDGQVTFRDRVFEVLGGTADFRPDLGLAAALNISAESAIDTTDTTYIVDVRVTGTTRDPRVTISSDDPSLTQTDLATLLAVGKTSAQLREGSGSMSLGMQQDTRQLLPIDRVSFESSYSRTTGTFEPQLKLGKDLTDNLAASVGQTFGVSSRTQVEADYRLSPRIFLLGGWESETSTQEGAFSAGLKVRYEFWRLTPYTLLGGLR